LTNYTYFWTNKFHSISCWFT